MKSLAFLFLFLSSPSWAIDAYDSLRGQLTIPTVQSNNTLYSNVVVTLDKVISIQGGTPIADYDSYVSYSGYLFIPSVIVGTTTYNNVTITIGNVISIGGSKTACVNNPNKSQNIYQMTSIDMRFEQYSDFDVNGNLVNSFIASAPILDKIKCNGFNTVAFQTNIPIDANTGLLTLFDSNPSNSNRDKNLPLDFWKLISYAKSIGLIVFIKAEPTYYVNDAAICSFCGLGPNFSIDKFFNTLSTYGVAMAAKAKMYGVDGFYVGDMNMGLDDDAYISQWMNLISAYRSVFDGKLIYTTCWNCGDKKLFDYVDIIGLNLNPTLNTSAIYDLRTIVNSYQMTQDDANHGGPQNAILRIKDIYNRHKKPILLDEISISAGDKFLGSTDIWNMLMTNQDLTSLKPDYALQGLRIAAVFELIGKELTKEVIGIEFQEYDPWMEAVWITTPSQNPSYPQWHTNSIVFFNMVRNDAAQNIFMKYFSKPWGYMFLQ